MMRPARAIVILIQMHPRFKTFNIFENRGKAYYTVSGSLAGQAKILLCYYPK
jgi:hypothetical protein